MPFCFRIAIFTNSETAGVCSKMPSLQNYQNGFLQNVRFGHIEDTEELRKKIWNFLLIHYSVLIFIKNLCLQEPINFPGRDRTKFKLLGCFIEILANSMYKELLQNAGRSSNGLKIISLRSKNPILLVSSSRFVEYVKTRRNISAAKTMLGIKTNTEIENFHLLINSLSSLGILLVDYLKEDLKVQFIEI